MASEAMLDDGTISITVKTLRAESVVVDVQPDITIPDLKMKISELTSVDASQQRLIFRGKVMKNDHKLSDYGVQDGQALHMVAGPSPRPQETPGPPPAGAAPQRTPPVVVAGVDVHGGGPPDMNQMINSVLSGMAPLLGNLTNVPVVVQQQGRPPQVMNFPTGTARTPATATQPPPGARSHAHNAAPPAAAEHPHHGGAPAGAPPPARVHVRRHHNASHPQAVHQQTLEQQLNALQHSLDTARAAVITAEQRGHMPPTEVRPVQGPPLARIADMLGQVTELQTRMQPQIQRMTQLLSMGDGASAAAAERVDGQLLSHLLGMSMRQLAHVYGTLSQLMTGLRLGEGSSSIALPAGPGPARVHITRHAPPGASASPAGGAAGSAPPSGAMGPLGAQLGAALGAMAGQQAGAGAGGSPLQAIGGQLAGQAAGAQIAQALQGMVGGAATGAAERANPLSNLGGLAGLVAPMMQQMVTGAQQGATPPTDAAAAAQPGAPAPADAAPTSPNRAATQATPAAHPFAALINQMLPQAQALVAQANQPQAEGQPNPLGSLMQQLGPMIQQLGGAGAVAPPGGAATATATSTATTSTTASASPAFTASPATATFPRSNAGANTTAQPAPSAPPASAPRPGPPAASTPSPAAATAAAAAAPPADFLSSLMNSAQEMVQGGLNQVPLNTVVGMSPIVQANNELGALVRAVVDSLTVADASALSRSDTAPLQKTLLPMRAHVRTRMTDLGASAEQYVDLVLDCMKGEPLSQDVAAMVRPGADVQGAALSAMRPHLLRLVDLVMAPSSEPRRGNPTPFAEAVDDWLTNMIGEVVTLLSPCFINGLDDVPAAVDAAVDARLGALGSARGLLGGARYGNMVMERYSTYQQDRGVGMDAWMADLAEEERAAWLQTINADVIRQQNATTHEPFSDAYVDGQPAAKRRRLARGRFDTTSTTALVETPLRDVLADFGYNVDEVPMETGDLGSLYAEQIMEDVRERLEEDADYLADPSAHTPSREFFGTK